MSKKRKKPQTISCEYFVWILRQRNGVYYADCRKGDTKLGKHSLGTRDQADALSNLKQLDRKMAVHNGILVEATTEQVPKPTNHVSIQDGWDAFFTHLAGPEIAGGAGPATRRRYRSVCNKHIRFCKHHDVTGWEQISKTHLQNYLTFLEKRHLSDRTFYLELTLLQSVRKFLIVNEHLPTLAKIHLPLQRPQGSDRFCYQLIHVQAMLDQCNSSPVPHWLAPLIQTLAFTGLRIEELVSLRRSDLICGQDNVPVMIRLTDDRASQRRKALGGHIRRTKGRRDRMIPIDPALGQVLKDLPRLLSGQLFQGPANLKLTQRLVRDVFIKDVITPLTPKFPTPEGEIGFEHGRLHSFRHFFISRAFLCGANEGDIREWVGHRDSKIVELYRHLRPEEGLRKLESLDLMGIRKRVDGLPSQCSVSL